MTYECFNGIKTVGIVNH